MSERSLILLGGGGHARVVADAARCSGVSIGGLLDDSDRPHAAADSIDHLAPLADLHHLDAHDWIIALGDLATRRALIERLPAHARAASVIHPSAIVSDRAHIGAGVFIGPGAIVNAGAHIDAHAIINSGAIVEHDCRVGVNTHIAPSATLAGNVSVGAHTLVGLGAKVLPGVAVGDACVVGAGAVVTHDVPDGATAIGVPARVLSSV